MKQVKKAYAMSDAKISFVSLVDKAANKKQFLITKADDGSAKFTSYGRILKMDSDAHYVTGIVYEPMVEDTDGNYMTESEITKAAHWFAKNGNNVDLQHCFQKCDGAAVVETFVAKSDMEIEGESIKKGTWVMTMEIENQDVWNAIEKGELTGFSMGGVGIYSEEDIDIDKIEKHVDEPKSLIKRLAKSLGLDFIEKSTVKENFKRRVKEENFYSAFYSLKSALEKNYNQLTGEWDWKFTEDEEYIKEALEDFGDIITQLLTSNDGIVKSLSQVQTTQKPILTEENMKKDEFASVVRDEITKAMATFNQPTEPVTDPTPTGEGEITKAEIAIVVQEEVQKAMEPFLNIHALPGNLNNQSSATGQLEKSETHYMTGMF